MAIEKFVDNFGFTRPVRVVFRDLDMNLTRHPGSNDFVTLTNKESIEASMRHLILTRRGERKFQPELGCSVYDQLFEPMSPLTTINIKKSIQEVLSNFEYRVTLEDVEVIEDFRGNGYTINIRYYIVNAAEEEVFTYFLERTR